MAKEVNKEKKTDKKVKNEKDKKSFAKDFKAELKKVSWPTFKQLVNNTGAVLAIVFIFAILVFVLDVIFESANNFGVEKLKALVTSSSTETVEENTVDTESEASSEAVDAEDKTVEAEPTAETEEEATETSDVENSSEENN